MRRNGAAAFLNKYKYKYLRITRELKQILK